MRAFKHLVVAVIAGFAHIGVNACTNCTNESTEPIEQVPAPWTLKGSVYSITLLPILDGLLGQLPIKAYPPLERQDPTATQGDYRGIIGMIQIIRYTESPVGPYDELLIVPGYFAYPRTDSNGRSYVQSRVRVSRIYVSQKYTNYNGRLNWNIPKHLAKFDWKVNSDGSTSVEIYPFDTTGDPSESFPASKPWFQMSFKPQLNTPIPFSTDFFKLIGVNATLGQPPLPQGNDTFGALPGTSDWKATVPGQKGKLVLGTFSMDQGAGDVGTNGTNAVGDEYYPNFWPGLGKRVLGYKLEDATITFSKPEVWK